MAHTGPAEEREEGWIIKSRTQGRIANLMPRASINRSSSGFHVFICPDLTFHM